MQSAIFNYIGIGQLDIAWLFIGVLALIVILLIVIIVQAVRISKLKKSFQKFMTGKDAKSLEKEIEELFVDIKYLKEAQKQDSDDIKILYGKAKRSYQKFGLVKYDAFHEMGGQLSFSLCMLDEDDNGFIINSVHSNAGCYVYTKEIVEGKSAISLGDEEEVALDKAIKGTQGISPAIEEIEKTLKNNEDQRVE